MFRYLGLLAIASMLLGPVQAAAASPVVVELFTSQGCSSCPPANANFAAIADRPDVLALSFGVTYWDQLGWKDTFARSQFTRRQYDYAHALRNGGPFTPQIVVNGAADGTGIQRSELTSLISGAAHPAGPVVTIQDGHVAITAAKAAAPADVWLVRYDTHTVNVPVTAGENTGVTLPHRNVVKQLALLGKWTGSALSVPLPPAQASLSTAILVQSSHGGPILAAAKG